MAPSYHPEAADHLDSHLHVGWIVRIEVIPRQPRTDIASVVLVSIIWVVVLSRLEETDVTCES